MPEPIKLTKTYGYERSFATEQLVCAGCGGDLSKEKSFIVWGIMTFWHEGCDPITKSGASEAIGAALDSMIFGDRDA